MTVTQTTLINICLCLNSTESSILTMCSTVYYDQYPTSTSNPTEYKYERRKGKEERFKTQKCVRWMSSS